MNIIPLIILLLLVVLTVLFLKLEAFRRYRIMLKIRWNYGMRLVKNLYYEGIYLIRLTAFIKTLVLIGVGLGVILALVFVAIYFWNEYIVFFARNILKINLNEVVFPSLGSSLMGRFNIFWILGALGGSLLSVFIKPKLDKFADKVNAKPNMIYIFGSNTLTQRVINEFIKLGIGPLVALIADKKYYWIEELGKIVDVLILDSPEELRMPTIYDKIKFKNALKIISLVDSPEDNQHIILNVRRNNPEAEIIVLSRNKPYILDLVGEKLEKITIIEDLETITREIIRRLALGFIHAPVIEAYVPEDYLGRSPKLLEEDFNGKIKVLGVKRNGKIIFPEKLNKDDKLIIYLLREKAIQEFLQLLPLEKTEIVMEETKEIKAEVPEKRIESKEENILEKLKEKKMDKGRAEGDDEATSLNS